MASAETMNRGSGTSPVYVRWCGAQPVERLGEALLRLTPCHFPLEKIDVVAPDLLLRASDALWSQRLLLTYTTLVTAARTIRREETFWQSQLRLDPVGAGVKGSRDVPTEPFRTDWVRGAPGRRLPPGPLAMAADPTVAHDILWRGHTQPRAIRPTVDKLDRALRAVWGIPDAQETAQRPQLSVRVTRAGLDDQLTSEQLKEMGRAVLELPALQSTPDAEGQASGDRDAPVTRLAVRSGLPSDLDGFLGHALSPGAAPDPSPATPSRQRDALAYAINLRRHQRAWFGRPVVAGSDAPLIGGSVDDGRMKDDWPGLGLRLPFSTLVVKSPFRLLVENTHAFEEVARAITFRATDSLLASLYADQVDSAFRWYVAALACEYEYGTTVEDLSPTRVLTPALHRDAGTDRVRAALRTMASSTRLMEARRQDQVIRSLIGVEAFGWNETFDPRKGGRGRLEVAGERYAAHRGHLAWKRRARLRAIIDHVQAVAQVR